MHFQEHRSRGEFDYAHLLHKVGETFAYMNAHSAFANHAATKNVVWYKQMKHLLYDALFAISRLVANYFLTGCDLFVRRYYCPQVMEK